MTGGRAGSRSYARSAARGATALAGAQAYRLRDAQALADLGLDLAELDRLGSDRARCVRLADALLGMPAHPLDAALKAASIQTMSDALAAGEPVDSDVLVDRFLANLAWEQALVELTSQQRDEPVPPAEAARVEKDIKEYLQASVEAERRRERSASGAAGGPGPADADPAEAGQDGRGPRIDPQRLVERAAGLAGRVLRIFRRRG